MHVTGALSGPLRNYVLSNTTQVYERSYQPRHVRENLANVAFRKLVKKDEELFGVLQDASLSRDANAPLCVSQKDLDNFNNRRDIRNLRAQYANMVAAASSNAPEAKRIAARIKWVLDWLCDLRVAELRKAYFEDVDKLRSLGRSTLSIRDAATAINPRRSIYSGKALSAEEMAQLLENGGSTKEDDKDASNPFDGELLAAYLRCEPLRVPPPTEAKPTDHPVPSSSSSKARCLLCNSILSDRSKLTRHVRARHTFDESFSCPECMRRGKHVTVAAGGAAWAAHAERSHGRLHTPVLRDTKDDLAKMMLCPLCGKPYRLGTALSLHLTKHHGPRGHFEHPASCVLCGDEVQGSDGWSLHLDGHIQVHIGNEPIDSLTRQTHGGRVNRCSEPLAGKKRRREEDSSP